MRRKPQNQSNNGSRHFFRPRTTRRTGPLCLIYHMLLAPGSLLPAPSSGPRTGAGRSGPDHTASRLRGLTSNVGLTAKLYDPQAGAPPANHQQWRLMVASGRDICSGTQETLGNQGILENEAPVSERSAMVTQWRLIVGVRLAKWNRRKCPGQSGGRRHGGAADKGEAMRLAPLGIGMVNMIGQHRRDERGGIQQRLHRANPSRRCSTRSSRTWLRT